MDCCREGTDNCNLSQRQQWSQGNEYNDDNLRSTGERADSPHGTILEREGSEYRNQRVSNCQNFLYATCALQHEPRNWLCDKSRECPDGLGTATAVQMASAQ